MIKVKVDATLGFNRCVNSDFISGKNKINLDDIASFFSRTSFDNFFFGTTLT